MGGIPTRFDKRDLQDEFDDIGEVIEAQVCASCYKNNMRKKKTQETRKGFGRFAWRL